MHTLVHQCRHIGLTTVMLLLLASLLGACSATKHVPQGHALLDAVTIRVLPVDSAGNGAEGLRSSDLINYLRQRPNHTVLGFARLQLGVYNLSGRDTTKRVNRWLRQLGQPPVIYDDKLTQASRKQLQLAAVNKGYHHSTVMVDSVVDSLRRRVKVIYTINPGMPHRLRSVSYNITDSALAPLIRDTQLSTLRTGNLLDRNLLDGERTQIAARLRNNGYFDFNKEYITFRADTAMESNEVDLTVSVRPPRLSPGTHYVAADTLDGVLRHRTYRIGKVIFITDYGESRQWPTDTVDCSGLEVVYGADRYIRPEALEQQCFIRPGALYRASDADRTYQGLCRLGILRSISVDFKPAEQTDSLGDRVLDAYIYLTRNKKQGLVFELEGTNSEGDLGFGVGMTYKYRNLGRASNMLTAKFRGNYESLSGNLSGLINRRFTEFAGEVGITFPKFVAPFLHESYKRRVTATTELALSANYQERPEYTRIIAGAAYRYRWNTLDGRDRKILDLIDINYVKLPRSTIDFLNQIAPGNPLLRYSYEDHFVMRIALTYHRTNRRIASSITGVKRVQPLIYTTRASIETAGNLLYALSSVTGKHRNDGVYKIFGTQFSQYAKADVDYTLTRNFVGGRHALAFRAGFGIGVPYGNSSMMPFEKRFYGGGANGVRGWSVRSLGPGSYDGNNSLSDFINQCGDIMLTLSSEYRTKLFWVFEGALFVDAGNIWTIRDYPNQPGGMFRFKNFYKEIAASYGIGLRLDFDYFLLRFDLGIKACNPAAHTERWPLLHPDWSRDATFHFAVGYPF